MPAAAEKTAPTGVLIWVIPSFVLSELLARWLGIHFADNTLGNLYQYLDPEILRNDLLRGLYYLHAQPPLFNLYLGATLKAFGPLAREAFAVSFAAFGLGLLFAMAWLMSELGVPRRINAALCLLLACSANFMIYTHWLFYTLPVALLVVAGAVAMARFVASGSSAAAHGFAWSAGTLMLTRAVYHPVWLLGVLLAVVPALERSRRKTLVAACLAPLLLVGLVYFKNYRQAGSFSGSSWLGMSLAKRWPLSKKERDALCADGHLPPVWHRRPFREPRELEAYGYFHAGRPLHPALDSPYKSNGEPNFNHRDYARISRAMLRGDLHLIRHYPHRYLQRVLTAFLLFLQPGPNSVHFLVDYDFTKVHRLRDRVTRWVFLGGPIERPIRMLEPPVNLLCIGFPLLLIFGAYRALRGPSRPVFAYIVVTAVWVSLTVNLIEIGENDRMRWEIEPLLVVLLGCAVSSFLGRLKRS